jgi:flagellar biosynthetic protein FliQ
MNIFAPAMSAGAFTYMGIKWYEWRYNMDSGDVITIARQTIWVIVKTSVPILLVSMIVGLVISLFQTLTSIQEQTLTFVPKLIAIMIALLIMGTWMLNEITSYMNTLWGSFARYIS